MASQISEITVSSVVNTGTPAEQSTIKVATTRLNEVIAQTNEITSSVRTLIPESIKLVDTIDNLKAIDLSTIGQTTIRTLGKTTKGDGGLLDYYWDSTSEEDYDDFRIVKANDVSVGRWILLNSTITPELFGAKGDGVTDDFDALTEMFEYLNFNSLSSAITAVEFTRGKNYRISEPLTVVFKTDSNLPRLITGYGSRVTLDSDYTPPTDSVDNHVLKLVANTKSIQVRNIRVEGLTLQGGAYGDGMSGAVINSVSATSFKAGYNINSLPLDTPITVEIIRTDSPDTETYSIPAQSVETNIYSLLDTAIDSGSSIVLSSTTGGNTAINFRPQSSSIRFDLKIYNTDTNEYLGEFLYGLTLSGLKDTDTVGGYFTGDGTIVNIEDVEAIPVHINDETVVFIFYNSNASAVNIGTVNLYAYITNREGTHGLVIETPKSYYEGDTWSNTRVSDFDYSLIRNTQNTAFLPPVQIGGTQKIKSLPTDGTSSVELTLINYRVYPNVTQTYTVTAGATHTATATLLKDAIDANVNSFVDVTVDSTYINITPKNPNHQVAVHLKDDGVTTGSYDDGHTFNPKNSFLYKFSIKDVNVRNCGGNGIYLRNLVFEGIIDSCFVDKGQYNHSGYGMAIESNRDRYSGEYLNITSLDVYSPITRGGKNGIICPISKYGADGTNVITDNVNFIGGTTLFSAEEGLRWENFTAGVVKTMHFEMCQQKRHTGVVIPELSSGSFIIDKDFVYPLLTVAGNGITIEHCYFIDGTGKCNACVFAFATGKAVLNSNYRSEGIQAKYVMQTRAKASGVSRGGSFTIIGDNANANTYSPSGKLLFVNECGVTYLGDGAWLSQLGYRYREIPAGTSTYRPEIGRFMLFAAELTADINIGEYALDYNSTPGSFEYNPSAGQVVTFMFKNDATGRAISFNSTYWKLNSTVASTASKVTTISFIYMFGAFYEISRTSVAV